MKYEFRGLKDNGYGWAYGNLIQFDWGDFIVAFNSFENRQRVLPDSVGRLSPFTDRDGSMIWEGDLLEVEREHDMVVVQCCFGSVQRIMDTGFLVDICGFYFAHTDGKASFLIVNNYAGKHDSQVIKVIGNIYQNPELFI